MRLKRMDPRLRARSLMPAAIEAAKRYGFADVTRQQIADQAGCSAALITKHLGTMTALRRDLMRYAVRHEIVELVAQGLGARHATAMRAPEELRRRAATYLMRGTI